MFGFDKESDTIFSRVCFWFCVMLGSDNRSVTIKFNTLSCSGPSKEITLNLLSGPEEPSPRSVVFTELGSGVPSPRIDDISFNFSVFAEDISPMTVVCVSSVVSSVPLLLTQLSTFRLGFCCIAVLISGATWPINASTSGLLFSSKPTVTNNLLPMNDPSEPN